MNYRIDVWRQWNKQETKRLDEETRTQAHIQLSNLYLAVERGDVRLTISVGNQLRTLVNKVYDITEVVMNDYWLGEFIKLEGWNDV